MGGRAEIGEREGRDRGKGENQREIFERETNFISAAC